MKQNNSLPFVKMHGLGNDFIVLDERDLKETKNIHLNQMSILAKVLCNRHFGIGADGLIIARDIGLKPDSIAWTYINGDGSSSSMCGNGLRCLALWAVNRHYVKPPHFAIETNIGFVQIQFQDQDKITVDLKEPALDSQAIPIKVAKQSLVVKEKLHVLGQDLIFTCVSMGNPHCVIFDPPKCSNDQLAKIASAIQALDLFPESANVEFVFVENPKQANMLVWERGCGATLACASGAAAVLVAGVLEEKLSREAVIRMPGGELEIYWQKTDNRVYMKGPACEVFCGALDLNLLKDRLTENEFAS